MEIKGLLIDLDGVIYNDSQPIVGAKETISWLKEKHIPFCFITNTTMKHRSTLVTKLANMEIEVSETVVFSAAFAAAQYVKQFKDNRAFLLLTDDAKKEFLGTAHDDTSVNFVVLGDLGDDFTVEKINKAFNCFINGAKLIALQKNRFWLSDDGYRVDAGAFVALLEYAAKVRAKIIGKPSKTFFRLALKHLNINANQALMIGDDVESDIMGANRLGINTCLVQTGKFRPIDLQRLKIKPDFVLPSIAQLPEFFENLKR